MFATDNLKTLMIGNKSDSPYRAVAATAACQVSESLGIPVMEASAKNGANVDQAFLGLTEELLANSGPVSGDGEQKDIGGSRRLVETGHGDRTYNCCIY